jgi:DNA polymerase epsilon subunit 2
MRNDSFQTTSFSGKEQANKITPISNLLGRSGSAHLLLGLLIVSPTGTLALSDLSGSIALDLEHARPFPDDNSAWFCPGMLVLVEGKYYEDYSTTAESALGNTGGIGGTIGGKFIGSAVVHPPCERRTTTLGIQETAGAALTGPAFGWTDFIGVGSERATGNRMRRLEQQILGPGAPHAGNAKIAIASELNIDNPATLTALKTMLSFYSAMPTEEFPMALVLMGNFASHAALSGAPGAGSIEYKEYFNALASILSDFPQLIARLNMVFVPGDQDAWPSAFSGGAAAPIPRKAVPEMFTTRIRRVMGDANREVGGGSSGRKEGEVTWTSNPARMSWFGCAGEMVLFRDDITGRLRRTALRFKDTANDGDGEGKDSAAPNATPDAETQSMDVDAAPLKETEIDPDILTARRLTKTLLDQTHLSPFPISTRPVHWDYGSALQLYPLPTALVIADAEAPAFALNYMGCCVMNPGKLIDGRRGERARWVEFDVITKKGLVRSEGG